MKVKDIISEGKKFEIGYIAAKIRYDDRYYKRIYSVIENDFVWVEIEKEGQEWYVDKELASKLESLYNYKKQDLDKNRY